MLDAVKKKIGAVKSRVPHLAVLLLTAGMTAASAQTTGNAGATNNGADAVTGLGLDTMVQTVATGIRTTISQNSSTLMLAVLPIMAFFFIWNRLRSIF